MRSPPRQQVVLDSASCCLQWCQVQGHAALGPESVKFRSRNISVVFRWCQTQNSNEPAWQYVHRNILLIDLANETGRRERNLIGSAGQSLRDLLQLVEKIRELGIGLDLRNYRWVPKARFPFRQGRHTSFKYLYPECCFSILPSVYDCRACLTVLGTHSDHPLFSYTQIDLPGCQLLKHYVLLLIIWI